jgi:hypothetical protein
LYNQVAVARPPIPAEIPDVNPSPRSKGTSSIDAHMTCRNFQVFRVLRSTLRMKAQAILAAEVRKVLSVEKR